MDQKILNAKLLAHKEWIESNGEKGIRLDLTCANLRGANLTGANIDFSTIPMWCGGLYPVTDRKLCIQLAYTLACWLQSRKDLQKDENKILEVLKPYANEFHITKMPRL